MKSIFFPLWVQSNNWFPVSLLFSFRWSNGIWSELKTDCWMIHTDVPKRLTFLNYASYVLVGCGTRIHFSSRIVSFLLYWRGWPRPLSQNVWKLSKNSCAIEGTQAIAISSRGWRRRLWLWTWTPGPCGILFTTPVSPLVKCGIRHLNISPQLCLTADSGDWYGWKSSSLTCNAMTAQFHACGNLWLTTMSDLSVTTAVRTQTGLFSVKPAEVNGGIIYI